VDIETRSLVAIIAIISSSTFAAIGLLLNFVALRRNNRIAVSTKLAELSKLITDELIDRVNMLKLCEAELEVAEAYPDKVVSAPKVESLKMQIEANLKRQNELDQEAEYLEKALSDLDNVDIAGVDAHFVRLYRSQQSASAYLKFAQQLKKER